MALPVIAVAVLARLLLRGSIVAARKYAAKNGVRISATVLKNARQLNKVKNIKNIKKGNKKPSLSKKKKIDYKAKSAKQKNIQKKIAEKAAKKSEKQKPGFTKITPKHRKKSAIKKDKKSTTKKVDKKSLATAGGKIPNIPKSKALTVFKGKKPPSKVITKIAKTKKFKPGFLTGVAIGGGAPILYDMLTKKKKSPQGIWKGKKRDKEKKIIPKIKPKPYPKDDDFDKESSPYIKGSAAPKKTADRSQYQTARPSATFEARVRALVAQKDKLKNIEAGDGRSEYQVRMHKLKKENKKAWKQLFTMGGKLK